MHTKSYLEKGNKYIENLIYRKERTKHCIQNRYDENGCIHNHIYRTEMNTYKIILIRRA